MRSARRPGLSSSLAAGGGTVPAAAASGLPLSVRSRQLVLLRGQLGSGADWQQVMARLLAQMPAVAADRPDTAPASRPLPGRTFLLAPDHPPALAGVQLGRPPARSARAGPRSEVASDGTGHALSHCGYHETEILTCRSKG